VVILHLLLLCAQNWLDLSLNRGLPSSLLLLSRAFTLTGPIPAVAAGAAGAADDLGRVKETLLTLPEEVIEDVGLEVAAPATGKLLLLVLMAVMMAAVLVNASEGIDDGGSPVRASDVCPACDRCHCVWTTICSGGCLA
jgi:hypothetical protein